MLKYKISLHGHQSSADFTAYRYTLHTMNLIMNIKMQVTSEPEEKRLQSEGPLRASKNLAKPYV